jgi:16S rRNA (cytosine1402-N4)-methyltransferase
MSTYLDNAMLAGEYHISVLRYEAVSNLVTNPEGIYVDATLGGGGHSESILGRLAPEGRLIAFDQDPDAHANIRNNPVLGQDKRLQLVRANFRELQAQLQALGIERVDGVLADLGVSSHQFDTPERGFSYRFDAGLDMRMDPEHQELTAAEWLDSVSYEELAEVFREYGDMTHKMALKMAVTITSARPHTTYELNDAVAKRFGRRNLYASLSLIYQSIRMKINSELEALESFLKQCPDVLWPGGRLCVISFHSLEDRQVKHLMNVGLVPGGSEPLKDFYGNVLRPFTPLTRQPITPGAFELRFNPRSRSARLRVAERNNLDGTPFGLPPEGSAAAADTGAGAPASANA